MKMKQYLERIMEESTAEAMQNRRAPNTYTVN